MEVKEILNKDVWENFFKDRKEKTFLQSWNWGEVCKENGNKIWRLGLYDKEKLVLVVLAIKIAAKRGKFLLVPHCVGMEEILLNKLKEIAKMQGCSFIRVAPLIKNSQENIRTFKSLGFIKSPMHASAYEATLRLDITLPEETLLKNMRKTTRYLIKRAEKDNNIKIVTSDKIKDIESFLKLIQETARHKLFVPFPSNLVRKEFEIFSKNNQARLLFGEYKGEKIAGALVIFWSGIAFYHQAAFLPQYHKVPIVYSLQWKAIKMAKELGCSFYDFWGYVDPEEKPKHPWAGPTFFKVGFGGKVYEYLKTQDLPLSKKYWLTYFFEMLRKKVRRL
jgi:lipid II:glycine glycyltransferase (peptidoglycan interpeptide bridge formation enzyme)